ncbi:hypothetical protein OL233_06285 [Vagococcus sp. PNs007]|uniref:SdpI family protein n=1 Tax=Vagococcus proximus TaxID=2991417 RepID=A0ABT5X1M3_9ENTE|nr:hypothetical protein [Vagococcus proximus]MDF0479897.1 hypothetical protein [Vagococcus proximus]
MNVPLMLSTGVSLGCAVSSFIFRKEKYRYKIGYSSKRAKSSRYSWDMAQSFCLVIITGVNCIYQVVGIKFPQVGSFGGVLLVNGFAVVLAIGLTELVLKRQDSK